jgi:Xaa-Pro aminopeptidase
MAESKTDTRNANRSTTPVSETFKKYISEDWADRTATVPAPRESAAFAAARREQLGARYPGKRIVIPAGAAKVRSNDTDYPYRAHSAFAHLTGWGSDSEPGAVLVLEPTPGGGHAATVYFRERADRSSDEFYANPAIGEFWIGPRPSLAQVAGDLGLDTRGIADFDGVIASADADTLVVRDADRDITAQLDSARLVTADSSGSERDQDLQLARDLSELRLVKDSYEVAQLRLAVAATKQGFDDVIADLPAVVAHAKGERLVEGTFNRRARAEGNTVGYDTIAAAGEHACILHWTRNDGPVRPGDMILLDAGIELDSYYTADITRTLPVSGTFTDAQREVYDAVFAAQEAGIAAVRPGNRFSDVHAAAVRVIAEHLHAWGLLPDGVSVDDTLDKEHGQYHRRWMVHGTSHHLGLDVHDCALATREEYMDAVLEPGMVLTVEPGLYFKSDDLLAPERFRGIGVRIEDDVVVTDDGCENLSAAMPRSSADVEAWIAQVRAR